MTGRNESEGSLGELAGDGRDYLRRSARLGATPPEEASTVAEQETWMLDCLRDSFVADDELGLQPDVEANGNVWRGPKHHPLAVPSESRSADYGARQLLFLMQEEGESWTGSYHNQLGILDLITEKTELTNEEVESILTIVFIRTPDLEGMLWFRKLTARFDALGFRGEVFVIELPAKEV